MANVALILEFLLSLINLFPLASAESTEVRAVSLIILVYFPVAGLPVPKVVWLTASE